MIRIIKTLMRYLPGLSRKGQLYFLFKITAKAFGCKKPSFSKMSYDEALREFARFTQEQAEKTLREGKELETVKSNLYYNSFLLSTRIRKMLFLSSPDDVLTLCKLLYKNIGIDLAGNLPGEITMKSCYFSVFYSSQVCQIISSLDEGIIAGFLGGGKLHFEQRITEGSPCCRAYFYE